MSLVRRYFVLCKVEIALLASCSTATGFALTGSGGLRGLLLVSLGVFILAAGSAALNEWQEWRLDALMERTKNRPIPRGDISPNHGFCVAVALITIGLVILQIAMDGMATGLGALAVLWYNGVYTPLKAKTPFAAVPGGVVGAIPPMIGWVAAGGIWNDPRILILSLVLFVWQTPHFWLLLLRFGPDYERAGFPTLMTIFSKEQVSRLIFVWILATVAVTFTLPFFGVVPAWYFLVTVAPCALWLVWKSAGILKLSAASVPGGVAFGAINLFLLEIMVALSASRFVA